MDPPKTRATYFHTNHGRGGLEFPKLGGLHVPYHLPKLVISYLFQDNPPQKSQVEPILDIFMFIKFPKMNCISESDEKEGRQLKQKAHLVVWCVFFWWNPAILPSWLLQAESQLTPACSLGATENLGLVVISTDKWHRKETSPFVSMQEK